MEDFMKSVEIHPNGCWIWTGPTCAAGRYGRVSGKTPLLMAHRLSYELFNGAAPGKNFVCHHCDNGLCVNPKHLFLGDMKANMLDMVRKNRSNGFFKIQRGEENANAKLKKCDVDAIRKYFNANRCSYAELAQKFGLRSKGHAHSIATGKIWK